MTPSSLVHDLENNTQNQMPVPMFLVLLIAAIIFGVSAGYFLQTKEKPKMATSSSTSQQSGKTIGVIDKTIFKDQAEGVLQDGGIEGEGSFHLVRPGGPTQYVYLTSSTVDLSNYIGKKIRVHGQTMNGQKAGWLMEVGSVELL